MIVSREQMRAVAKDAGTLGGLGDGISIGYGRFVVTKWEELTDAEESPAEGSVDGDSEANLDARRREVPKARLRENGAVESVSH